MATIILDLDGTLCDHSHRTEHAIAKDWDAYHSLIPLDDPHPDILFLMRMVVASAGYGIDIDVLALTGRPAKWRPQTLAWLIKHQIPVSDLVMRPDGDYTEDWALKPRLAEEYFGSREKLLDEVMFVLDDRDRVVEAWRNYGLPCWQVRLGAF